MLKTEKDPGELSKILSPASRLGQIASKALHRGVPHLPSRRRYNLTVSDERKFLWYRVAKVGTRSMFGMFEKNGIDLSVEHAMFCHYAPEAYRDYFKFAFVRNPWDRIASAWRNKVVETDRLRREADRDVTEFDDFLRWLATKDQTDTNHHIRQQTWLIDLNEVDFVGRFENFDEDVRTVMDRIGVADVALEHRNATRKSGGYQQYYSDEGRAIVAKLYAQEISIFGYRFDD